MLRPGSIAFGACGVIVLAMAAYGAGKEAGPTAAPIAINKVEVIDIFFNAHAANDFRYSGNRIDRVFGPAFSTGPTAVQSAENFKQQYSGLWGVPAAEVIPVGPFEDGRHTVPMMYDPETGTYKFTGVFFTQSREGIPVFDSKLVLLVRNEAGYPLVLASSSLRDLGTFQVSAALQAAGTGAGVRAVKQIAGPGADVGQPQYVIWAGVDEINAAPVLAEKIIVEINNPVAGSPQAWMYIVDAANGNVLHRENLIYDINVSGNISGMATTGFGADTCGGIASTPMPYAKASIGATSVFADANGNFTIPNAGSSNVTVVADLTGLYFDARVCNGTQVPSPQGAPCGSPAPTSSQSVTPPGPANFVFNALNNSELRRAEVNAYLQANVVRDYLLAHNPAFPTISGETGFDLNINIGLNCNAFYSSTSQSINFYVAGGGCTNTSNSTVVHHEYGHRIVNAAGSGQGAYGEGFGDCMAVIVTDQSCLGEGFNAPCGAPGGCLRNANNNCLYQTSGCSSCGSEIHDCGRLISGCIWSVRNNLLATNPGTYRQIISNLTINSVLMHTGSTITPSITVDFLTLDDNDADISNGTPHYNEINSGFSAHNMPGPALAPLAFSYPNGRPALVSPSGGTTMRVVVSGLGSTPQPNTGKLFVDSGSGFVQSNMTQISANVYDAVFPASTCGVNVKYYVTAQTTTAQTVASPSSAPGSPFVAISAVSAGPVVFNDNFNTNMGWTISNSGSLTAGGWERATPRTDCSRGNPLADGDGSGMCYLSQNANGPAGDVCNSDIDGGTTTLTSPIMDASQGVPVLSYIRWYTNSAAGNTAQDDPFVVEFSINGGSSWINLETVGPNGSSPIPVVLNAWIARSFSMTSVPGFSPTSQFRVRFTAQDLGTASVVEAGVDAVRLQRYNCVNPCPSDSNGDGQVNVTDLLAVINGWGPCAGCPADSNGDGQINVTDLLAVINGWGACP